MRVCPEAPAVAILQRAGGGFEIREGLTLEQAREAVRAHLRGKGQVVTCLHASSFNELYHTPNGRGASIEIHLPAS